MSAEANRLAHFRALVEQFAPAGAEGKRQLKNAFNRMATDTRLSYDYLYQVYTGKSGKKGLGARAVRAISNAYRGERPENWMDLPVESAAPNVEGVITQEGQADYFDEPVTPLTLGDAVSRITELLIALDREGRAHASTALSNLVKSPTQRSAAKATQMLLTLERLHSREPQPDPTSPTPTTAGKTEAAARSSPSRAHLTVKTGGGQKLQLVLPFKAKVADNPWDLRTVSKKELDWYVEVARAPRASNGG